jgi:hopene-associated glycosyltransferase HpnB
MTLSWLALPGLLIWLSILILPWRPWSTRESLDADTGLSSNLSSVTVLIPARNEEDVIARTLTSLTQQGDLGEIILIDDQSTDLTVESARQTDLRKLTVINGRPLAKGWSGKLWALEQGREKVNSEYTLLLDADIELQPGTVATLLHKLNINKLDMVSLMAFLRMQSFWEVLLMPAFIYFFKLLYPFALSNSGSRLVAAAAGGCILVKTARLEEIGGFAALKDELIDDCSLARRIKQAGGRCWIGLSHSAISHRCYDTLQTIWDMVARTAYTQLHYSVSLLLVCTLLMIIAFVLPIFSMFVTDLPIVLVSVVAYLMMIVTYLPVLKYYERNPLWACTLPVTGVLYLCMTWGSAFRHWRGTGAIWKNRAYARPAG